MNATELAIRDIAIREIGCIACWLQGYGFSPCEKHHLNEGDQPGRKRIGERATVGLCQWHHVGRCWCLGFPVERRCDQCLAQRGPSWRYDKRGFITAYGDGVVLLQEQDKRIAEWRSHAITRGYA